MKKYHSPKEVLESAQSNDTSADELDGLLSCGYSFVNEAIAGNINTSLETLEKLIPKKFESEHEHTQACILARNPNSDIFMMQKLIQIPASLSANYREHNAGFRADIYICCNEKTLIDDIKNLVLSSSTAGEFRRILARETNRLDVLEILLFDNSQRVRRMAERSMQRLLSK